MESNPNFDVMLGAPVVELLNREDITEIYVNDDGFIRYESYREGKIKTMIYLEPAKVQAVIELVAGQIGKIVNEDIPSISAEIQGYGARFQGEIPPIVRQPQLNIRMKAVKIFSLEDYVENQVLTNAYKAYIEKAIESRKNILIVGGTGTGKTAGISERHPE